MDDWLTAMKLYDHRISLTGCETGWLNDYMLSKAYTNDWVSDCRPYTESHRRSFCWTAAWSVTLCWVPGSEPSAGFSAILILLPACPLLLALHSCICKCNKWVGMTEILDPRDCICWCQTLWIGKRPAKTLKMVKCLSSWLEDKCLIIFAWGSQCFFNLV